MTAKKKSSEKIEYATLTLVVRVPMTGADKSEISDIDNVVDQFVDEFRGIGEVTAATLELPPTPASKKDYLR